MLPITDKEFDEFREMCLNHDTWNKVSSDDVNQAYTIQTNTTSSLRLKIVSRLFEEFPMSLIFDVLHDPSFRNVWDVNVIKRKVIETIDEHNEIDYYSIKMPVVTNRDFVYHRAWRYTDDEFIIFNRSIKDDRAPEEKGLVRGFFHIGGYMVRKENGKCRLYYIVHNEWNGWIPNFVINTIGASVCPSVLGRLVDGCKTYEEWKQVQENQERPWKKLTC
ncbi:Phosphatidylcholine transfer protein [Entamoeba marina]